MGWGACSELLWTVEGATYCYNADALTLKKMFTLLLFFFCMTVGGVVATLGWPETLRSLS